MLTKFRVIGLLSLILCCSLTAATVHFGLMGVRAMQDNYIFMVLDKANTDLDRDGIADEYDDSDGDSIADKYDATPYGHNVDIFEIRTRGKFNVKQ